MKKSLKIASGIAGALVLITVAVLLILANMLLDPKPETPQSQLTPEDITVQNRILGQIFRSLTNRHAPTVAELKLTPQEFQSLIRCADRTYKSSEIPLREYRPVLGPERITLTIPYNTKQNWLFGGWIIGNFELKISKQGKKLDVQVLSASAGKFKISNETAQKILDEQLNRDKSRSQYEAFDKLVETLSIDKEGVLTVRYRPRNAIFLLKR